MRFINRFFTYLVVLVALCACNRTPDTPLKMFNVDSIVQCSRLNQNIEIKFSFDDSDIGKHISVSGWNSGHIISVQEQNNALSNLRRLRGGYYRNNMASARHHQNNATDQYYCPR